MTREKALAAMDRLVAMGYSVTLSERDMQNHVVLDPETREMTSIVRHLSIDEVSLDKVDLRALVAVADELDLNVGTWRLGEGKVHFTDPPDPVDEHKAAVVSGPRRHPR